MNNIIKLTLKAARVNAGLTQSQAADKIGISKYTLGNYEKGITIPRTDRLNRMAEIYNIKSDNFTFHF